MLLLSGNWLIRMKGRKLHSLKGMARWRVKVPGETSEPVDHAQMQWLLIWATEELERKPAREQRGSHRVCCYLES